MPKAKNNIYIDPETGAKAQELLADLGLDLSTAVNIFLRQMIRENAIPFEIRRDDPNEITAGAIEQAVANSDMYGPYDSVATVMEALNA